MMHILITHTHTYTLLVCIDIYILSTSSLGVSSSKRPPTATILPKIYFDPAKDANDINGLILKDDIRGVAATLGMRTNSERQEIKISYSQQYGRSLNEDLSGKAKYEFERLLTALLSPVPDYLIGEINWSLNQGKNWEYMSILCTSSGDLLQQMVAQYNKSFAWQMRDILSSKMRQTDGVQFLQNIIDSTPIRPNTSVIQSLVENQITFIPDRNGYCTQQENAQLFQFMSKSSFAQIAAVAVAYQTKTQLLAIDQIGTYCKGDLKEAYSRIVKYAVDPIAYFAAEIHAARTDDRALTLAILSRCEIDLVTIGEKFKDTYQTTLEKWVEGHAKGDYGNTLEIIISGKQF